MKRFDVRWVLLASAATVVGCSYLPSVGPDFKTPALAVPSYALPDAGLPSTNLTATFQYQPETSNADFRIEISTNVLARWWTRFDDPILERLIEDGVTNNIGFLMAQERLTAADYELLGSYAAFLPKFGANGLWNRYWANQNPRSGNGANGYHYNVQNVGLDGNWEIDLFGGSRRLSEAAFAQVQAEGWTVADLWVALTTQIGQQYINLRTTQAQIEVAITNLALQSETYDILKSRLDSGIGDELAVNQCAYVVEQTRARLPQLLAAEENAKNQLAVLAGARPGAVQELLKPVEKARTWLLDPEKVSKLNLDQMRGRPDVKAAESRLMAQTARIGVAKAQWFPKLFIRGTVGWESRNRVNLFSYESFLATLGPSISWPIFQGGQIYANVKATEARTREAALGYQQAIQNAYADVRNSYAAYTQEYHRYKALQAAVTAATDAVTISKDLYKNGLKDFNNVLDAQRSRLQLETEFINSRGQITLDLIALYRALGGGLAALDECEIRN